jgi:uroporphyrinogen decarboxylase
VNSLFLNACRRKKTERTPIWLMRQAGRYMKEYRDVRARVPFLELCKTPELAAQVTVEAAHKLDVDAAIIFSDILLILEPLGFKLTYEKDEGPQIHNPFRLREDLKRLGASNVVDHLEFVGDAIRETKKNLKSHIPLIGFAGAPFTVASYAIEGGGSRNFIRTKNLMLSDPITWKHLMGRISDATEAYVNAQIDAGADAIQFFDSWVGCLSPRDFSTFVLPYVKRFGTEREETRAHNLFRHANHRSPSAIERHRRGRDRR